MILLRDLSIIKYLHVSGNTLYRGFIKLVLTSLDHRGFKIFLLRRINFINWYYNLISKNS